ncbi:hypothetical protein VNO80_03425 [Phaseolus coccineus]|uniref:Transmembrane protein n=1 Tax=Phaseolus coccineus TaxID=3886 RepID=A0AAN9RN13_PHACN
MDIRICMYYFFFSLSLSLCNLSHSSFIITIIMGCNGDMLAIFSLINLMNEIPSLSMNNVVALDHIMLLWFGLRTLTWSWKVMVCLFVLGVWVWLNLGGEVTLAMLVLICIEEYVTGWSRLKKAQKRAFMV